MKSYRFKCLGPAILIVMQCPFRFKRCSGLTSFGGGATNAANRRTKRWPLRDWEKVRTNLVSELRCKEAYGAARHGRNTMRVLGPCAARKRLITLLIRAILIGEFPPMKSIHFWRNCFDNLLIFLFPPPPKCAKPIFPDFFCFFRRISQIVTERLSLYLDNIFNGSHTWGNSGKKAPR